MFPVTDDSKTIIDCFLTQAHQHGIKIEMNAGVEEIKILPDGFELICDNKKFNTKKVLIALGGHPNTNAYTFIKKIGHTIIPLIPSLFTFNDSQNEFKDLMGVSVPT
jgi:predicted flavoprotein YhiN